MTMLTVIVWWQWHIQQLFIKYSYLFLYSKNYTSFIFINWPASKYKEVLQ